MGRVFDDGSGHCGRFGATMSSDSTLRMRAGVVGLYRVVWKMWTTHSIKKRIGFFAPHVEADRYGASEAAGKRSRAEASGDSGIEPEGSVYIFEKGASNEECGLERGPNRISRGFQWYASSKGGPKGRVEGGLFGRVPCPGTMSKKTMSPSGKVHYDHLIGARSSRNDPCRQGSIVCKSPGNLHIAIRGPFLRTRVASYRTGERHRMRHIFSTRRFLTAKAIPHPWRCKGA